MTNNLKLLFFVSFIYFFCHKIQITIKQDSYTKANEIGEEAQKETIRLTDTGLPQRKNKVNSNSPAVTVRLGLKGSRIDWLHLWLYSL